MTRWHHRVEMGRESQHVILLGILAFWGTLPVLHAEEKTATTTHQTTHRVPLSPGQSPAILRLNQTRPEPPSPLFLFTDPNKDPDDLIVLVQSKYLQQQGFVTSAAS